MEMPEFDKKYAIVGLAIVALVFIAAFPNLSIDDPIYNKNVNDYGTIVVSTSTGTTISSLSTTQASKGLKVVWTATVLTSSIDAWAYTTAGVSIEKAIHTYSGYVHTFTFTLNSAPSGKNEMYIAFGGQYSADASWVGSSIHFYVEQDAIPTYPDPTFQTQPSDKTVNAGDEVSLMWWFIYSGPSTARVYVDNVLKSTKTPSQTTTSQPLSFITTFANAGVYKIKLTIDPENGVDASDEVTVTVLASTIPTTTTTTPTTTTTTTSPTGSTELPEPTEVVNNELNMPLLLLVIGVVVTIVFVEMRRRSD